MVEITLKRSLIGSKKNQKATAQALGLSKINQKVQKQDNEATRGMINVISHLVEVKEVK
ncbi:large subunit ribosomal protein L30 [Bacilli bacterium PM5-3]|nr:large subunit ribosomal protein L30 [Bacilli bacterium PM5-3]MDH6604202.1 large subunit ribosomal protein L30 [Bacilli bacterium PM5-9]